MPELDEISRALLDAQRKAEGLFAAVIELGVIAPGKLESEVSADIHAIAKSRFRVSRHWHKRIARAGSNTVLTYHDDPKDLLGSLGRCLFGTATSCAYEPATRTVGNVTGSWRFTSSTARDRLADSSKSC